MTGRLFLVLFSLLLGAQADTLILKDATRVTGRWWSIDATEVHFLVNNQLQHYRREDVSAVTFGDATPPAPSTPPPATHSQPSAAAAEPARAPSMARPSASAPQQPPTLARPSSSGNPAAAARGLSGPEEIGMVYFWNGKSLTPLERSQAAGRGRGGTQYWEMPGPQARVRLKEASVLVFVVRLPKGVDPASYSLFPLLTVKGARRTRPQQGRQGGMVTWPFAIETNDDSSYLTYGFRVRDLPIGEYSFSPSNSNDGYCFGVDAEAPGQ